MPIHAYAPITPIRVQITVTTVTTGPPTPAPHDIAAAKRSHGPDTSMSPIAMNHLRPQLARRGFSLVELLIVVMILGIVAALAAPMFGDVNSSKLRAAAQVLAADLAYAQAESITHNQDPRVVVFDTTLHAYHLAPSSDTANPIANPVGGGDYRVSFGSGRIHAMDGVQIASVSVGGDDVIGFGMYGNLDQGDDATVTLTIDAQSVTITLDADTGEASIGTLF